MTIGVIFLKWIALRRCGPGLKGACYKESIAVRQTTAPKKGDLMHTNAFLHFRDEDLLRKLDALVARDRVTTAELLTVMAEVDARRLYVPEGYPSMFAFCVEKLHLSEDAAYKRIQAARAARRFPALLDVIADGRLHLTGAGLLAPHLTQENAGELIELATHRRKLAIEEMLASRFGRAETPTRIRVLAPLVKSHGSGVPAAALQVPMTSAPEVSTSAAPTPQLAPAQVGGEPSAQAATTDMPAGKAAPPQTETADMVGSEKEISAVDAPSVPTPVQRYLLQCPISKETHDLLRYAQALLSHAVPNGEVDQVLQRALKALIPQLEKRKVAILTERGTAGSAMSTARRSGTGRSRPSASNHEESKIPVGRETIASPGLRSSTRHIPAHVRRAVWERDQKRCTFISASGRRCTARTFLQFDHIDPVARGGTATVDNLRLRCHAHNQYEAERVFGEDLIVRKREEARLAAAELIRERTSSTCAGAS